MSAMKLQIEVEKLPLREPFRISGYIWTELDVVVATLADGPFPTGRHDVRWDGPARPGVYFARIDTGSRHVSRRFVVLER